MRVGDLVEYLNGINPNTDLKITQRNGCLTTWIKVIPHDNEIWLMPFSEQSDSSCYDYDRCCPGACNGDFNE